MFWEHTYNEDTHLTAISLCIFFMTALQLWRLIEKDVASQFKPVSTEVPLTSIRLVNIIVFKFRCQMSWAFQCREAVGSWFMLLEMMVTICVYHKSSTPSDRTGRSTPGHTLKERVLWKWSRRSFCPLSSSYLQGSIYRNFCTPSLTTELD